MRDRLVLCSAYGRYEHSLLLRFISGKQAAD